MNGKQDTNNTALFVSMSERKYHLISQVLVQVSDAVATTSSLDQLYRAIHEALSLAVDTTHLFIALFDADKEQVSFPYVADSQKTRYSPAIKIIEFSGIPARIFRTRQTQFISRTDFLSTLSNSGHAGTGQSIPEVFLGVPLQTKNMILGALAVWSYSNPLEFSDFDREILESVSGQIATAIHYKQAEEALWESRERYTAVVRQTSEAIYLLDPQSKKILEANDAFLDMIEYDREEAKELSVYDFVAHDNKEIDRIIEQVSSLQHDQGKSFFVGERIYKKHDGTQFYVEASASRISFSGKSVLCVIARDITERQNSEIALRESEKKYRRLAENIKDAIYLLDYHGTIIDGNSSACSALGYTIEELLTLTVQDIDVHITNQKFEELHRDKEPGSSSLNESEHRRKDGTLIPVEINLSILEQDNTRIVFVVVRDITERKQAQADRDQLESQLRQAQKMEAIGTLAGGLAHDFNNLLMGIQGYVSLMLTTMEPDNPYCKNLGNIEKYVQSGARITNQLLGFARGGKYEVVPTELNKIIAQSSEMFGRTRREVTISTHLFSDLWVVEVDQQQIEQVFLNLYLNAWQAMPGGGLLSITTENVSFDRISQHLIDARPGNYVKITIQDNGVGMDEATRLKIFDPFFTTREKERGVGLGLSSVYGIIKNHGGFVEVTSNPGLGTRFEILIPASEKSALIPASQENGIQTGTETILLIDDEPMILEVGTKLLENLNYAVLTARGGIEGVTVFNQHRESVHLVILDMIMPGMGGSETFDKLRAIKPEIKILLSSGYSVSSEAQGILDRGCNAFIQKPFSLIELSRKIRSVLDK